MKLEPYVSPNQAGHPDSGWHLIHRVAHKLGAKSFARIPGITTQVYCLNVLNLKKKRRFLLTNTLNAPYCDVRRSMRAISFSVDRAALHGKYSFSCFKYFINLSAML